MQKLTRADLLSLEDYARDRGELRRRVMRHKKNRRVALGDHAALYFEDRLTIQYQIQEMLRVERIFEPEGIEDELNAYNPLIPDGANLKATFMIEFGDEAERRRALAKLVGIEARVWIRVEGFDPVWAIADEDLERDTPDKTSSVHFLRFEFNPTMIAAVKNGAALASGVDHPEYRIQAEALPEAVRVALAADFD